MKQQTLHIDHGVDNARVDKYPNSRMLPTRAGSPTEFKLPEDRTRYLKRQLTQTRGKDRVQQSYADDSDREELSPQGPISLYDTFDTPEQSDMRLSPTMYDERYDDANDNRHPMQASTRMNGPSQPRSRSPLGDYGNNQPAYMRNQSSGNLTSEWPQPPSPLMPAVDSQSSWQQPKSLETAASRHPPALTPLVIPHRGDHSNTESSVRSSSYSSATHQSEQISPYPGSYHSPSSAIPSATLPTSNSFTPQSISHLQAPIPSKSKSTDGVRSAATKHRRKSDDGPLSESDKLVQSAIKLHESGQLEKATTYFRRAAEMQNPIGMFLYGISLRHGWGCQAHPRQAFQFLQRAAEMAVIELNQSNDKNVPAAKSELVMAIYELGVSFRYGWGVKKDKAAAAYYFEVAANLGDADAQNDLGHCYYYGHGVKKDPYKAAKYYRLAAAQGQGLVGNSWIYKQKYDRVK